MRKLMLVAMVTLGTLGITALPHPQTPNATNGAGNSKELSIAGMLPTNNAARPSAEEVVNASIGMAAVNSR
jgi:hypothetical protein